MVQSVYSHKISEEKFSTLAEEYPVVDFLLSRKRRNAIMFLGAALKHEEYVTSERLIKTVIDPSKDWKRYQRYISEVVDELVALNVLKTRKTDYNSKREFKFNLESFNPFLTSVIDFYGLESNYKNYQIMKIVFHNIKDNIWLDLGPYPKHEKNKINSKEADLGLLSRLYLTPLYMAAMNSSTQKFEHLIESKAVKTELDIEEEVWEKLKASKVSYDIYIDNERYRRFLEHLTRTADGALAGEVGERILSEKVNNLTLVPKIRDMIDEIKEKNEPTHLSLVDRFEFSEEINREFPVNPDKGLT